MWKEIKKFDYDALHDACRYHIKAGGRMLNGGEYTEWTPYSALNAAFPDLRVEMKGGRETRFFAFEITY